MRIRLLILACFTVLRCQTKNQEVAKEASYSNDVGDILFNPLLDKKDFEICDSLNISTSRRGLKYLGQNGSIEQACMQKFTYQSSFESFSGFVTVRFIVNCQLETDRFRAQSTAFDFTEKDCPHALKDHLVQIVGELDQWMPAYTRYEGVDFVKYLNFKMEDGRITKVLQ